ncbi:hypothetical protein ACN47E_000465 [Coniothyrium glycines]
MSFTSNIPLMAIPRDPTCAEIAHFLSTRSGDQMVQLVQAIREPAAQAALTASLLFVPPPLAITAKVVAPEKVKKALNAFVGFRCYYITIPAFKPWPMKKLSNPMGIMWEADSNKSLWSLVTKAWSTIRDQIGKDKAPLDQFFRIICPFLNIPSPDSYLEVNGWSLSVDNDGRPTLSRCEHPSAVTTRAGFADMAVSVEDIITYCQSMGYAQGYIADTSASSATFLGHSQSQISRKNSGSSSVMEATAAVHEARVVARNKRRAHRQNVKKQEMIPVLQQQIVEAHLTDRTQSSSLGHNGYLDEQTAPFYDDLANLLSDHLSQLPNDTDTPHDTAPLAPMFDMDAPLIGDWNAFRNGADQTVTLPPYDHLNF